MDQLMRRAVLLAVFLFVCAVQLSESESEKRERRDTNAVANVKTTLVNLADENALREHHIVKRSWFRRRRRRRRCGRRRRRCRRKRVRIRVKRPRPPPPKQHHVHIHHHSHTHHHRSFIAQGCLRPCGSHAHCVNGACICNLHCIGNPYRGCHYSKK